MRPKGSGSNSKNQKSHQVRESFGIMNILLPALFLPLLLDPDGSGWTQRPSALKKFDNSVHNGWTRLDNFRGVEIVSRGKMRTAFFARGCRKY